MREGFESTNGRLRYSLSVYENATRATVPFAHEGEDRFYLLLSFDAHTDAGAIIANRVLPAIFEKGIRQNKKKKGRGYALFAHAVTVTVLATAPIAPHSVANTMLWSMCRFGSTVAIQFPTAGEARNARNPIANPIAENTPITPALDAIMITYCELPSVARYPEVGIEGNLSFTFCSATADASIIIWSMSPP